VKTTFLLIFISLILSTPCLTQNSSDTVFFTKNKIMYHGSALTNKEALDHFSKTDQSAYSEMKKAKINADERSVCVVIGSLCVVTEVGLAIAGAEPSWEILGAGGLFICAAIPLNYYYKRHAKRAVSLYNSRLKQLGTGRLDLKFGLCSNGVGITLNF
jgi:hypothetical protein